MKKNLTAILMIVILMTQLLPATALAADAENAAIRDMLAGALCNQNKFIERIDEAKKDDNLEEFVQGIELTATDSSKIAGTSGASVGDDGVLMYEDTIHISLVDMADELDYDLEWNEKEGTAELECEGKTIIVTTDANTKSDEVSGVVIDGEPYAPVEEIASLAGYSVEQSESKNEVKLRDEFIAKRLFVQLKHIDYLLDESLFEAFSEATDVFVNEDGLVFVEFETKETAKKACNLLEKNTLVEYAEPDSLVPIEFDSKYTWGTDYCNLKNYLKLYPEFAQSDKQVTVAVVDSGLNAHDPIFNNRVVYDSRMDSFYDNHGHGTNVAGIIAAFTDAVSDSIKISPYRIETQADGTFTHATVSEMYTVINKASDCQIINMSLSISPLSAYPTLVQAINASTNSLFVVAAGNEKSQVESYSLAGHVSAMKNGIVVTAIDKNGVPANFSNYAPTGGGASYIAAPGVDVYSASNVETMPYSCLSGTSQATPHVAALGAMIWNNTKYNNVVPNDIKNTILGRYYKTPAGWDTRYGVGIMYMPDIIKGSIGNNLTWKLESGVLTITGKGEIPDFSVSGNAPWSGHNSVITSIVFEGDILGITSDRLGSMPNLQSITVSQDNSEYMTVNGALYTKDGKTIVTCPAKTNCGEYVVAAGTTTIGNSAFANCASLASIVIPATVTKIEANALSDATGLYNIYYMGSEEEWNAIEKGENWDKNIGTATHDKKCTLNFNYILPEDSGKCGESAVWKYFGKKGLLVIEGIGATYDYRFIQGSDISDFSYDTPWWKYVNDIVQIDIKNGITQIGSNSFDWIKAKKIVLPDTVKSLKADIFSIYLEEIVLSECFESYDEYLFSSCDALTNIYVSEDNKNFSSKNGILYNKDGTELLVYPENKSDSAVIPSGTKRIGNRAFYGNYGLKKVKFCDTLEEIGDYAFESSGLKVLSSMPSSIKVIGKGAFSWCASLELACLPEGLQVLGANAFEYCSKLTTIYFPKSLLSMGSSIFTNCYLLNNAFYSGSQSDWNNINKAYDWNYSREHLEIQYDTSTTVTEVFSSDLKWTMNYATGTLSFEGKGNLPDYWEDYSPWIEFAEYVTHVEFSEGITKVGDYAFNNFSMINSVDFPESMTEIGECAFYNCALLTEITLPKSVKKLGKSAFSSCEGIIEITFLGNIEQMDSNVFYGDYNLKVVNFPENFTTIGDWAFASCTRLNISQLPKGLKNLGSYAFYNISAITTIEIPEGVTEIKNGTFNKCGNLSTIKLPKDLTAINDFAFESCVILSDIYYSGSKKNWYAVSKGTNWDHNAGKNTESGKYTIHYGEENSESGTIGDNLSWVYWEERKILEISGTGAMPDWEAVTDVPWNSYIGLMETVVVNENITSIGSNAFSNCSLVTSVSLPQSLTSIGKGAFSVCSALAEIDLPQQVTTIGEQAFYACSALESIVIPSGVTAIYDGTFKSCSKLKSIEMPNGIKSIGNETFLYCSLLESIVLPEELESIGNSAFKSCSSLKSIEIPTGVKSLGNESFSLCYALKDIQLPAGLETIGSRAFYYCQNLEELVLPSELKSIDINSFEYCKSLLNVKFSGDIENIGIYAFKDCKSLTRVIFEGKADNIDRYAFSACTALESVEFAKEVGIIGNDAFRMCSALESLDFSGGVREIGYSAFASCSALKSVKLPKNIEVINNQAFYDCRLLADIYYEGTNVEWYSLNKFSGWDKNAGIDTPTGTYNIHILGGISYEGICGESLAWTLDIEQGLLKITGAGAMWEWNGNVKPTWGIYKEEIKSVEIEDGVTTISAESFSAYENIVSVSIPKSITVIGKNSFSGCVSLETIYYAGSNLDWEAVTKDYNWASGAGEYTIVYGEEKRYTGSCGDNATWIYWEDRKILEISGLGEITSTMEWDRYERDICTMKIGEGITKIGKNAFYNFSALENVELPKGLQTIESRAFYGCSSLKSIEFTDGFESVGEMAFFGCSSLKSVTFSKGLKTIGNRAFSDCPVLEKIESLDGLETIGQGAFSGCSSLKSIELPKSIITIGDGIFSGCSLLSDIYYAGNSMEWDSISKTENWSGNPGTQSDTGTYKIHCRGGYIYSGSWGDNLTWSYDPDENLLKVKGKGVMPDVSAGDTPWKFYANEIRKVELVEGITSLGANTFSKYKVLAEISLPKSLVSVGASALYECRYLEKIYYPGRKTEWNLITFGTDWNKNAGKDTASGRYTMEYGEENFYAGSCGENITWTYWETRKLLEISGTGEITDTSGWSSYESYISIVNIGEGITSVPNSAFSYYQNLKEVILPSTIKTVEDFAFDSCKSLESITLPAGLESIGTSAFSWCTALKDIYYEGNNENWSFINKGTTWDSYAGSKTDLGKYILHFNGGYVYEGTCGDNISWKFVPEDNTLIISGAGEIKDWSDNDIPLWTDFGDKMHNVIIEEGVTRVGDKTFKNNTSIVEMHLPKTLVSIGEMAFYYATNLENINYAGTNLDWENVEKEYSWDYYAGAATASGKYTFSCTYIYTGNCGDDVVWNYVPEDKLLKITGTGFMVDYDYSNLPEWLIYKTEICRIEVGEGVTSIGKEAFKNLGVLTEVALPKSVTKIGNYAFGSCYMLETISYNGTTLDWLALNLGSGWDSSTGSKTSAGKYVIDFLGGEIYTGSLDENLTWTFVPEDKQLKINGTGKMAELSGSNPPWKVYADEIQSIEVGEGVISLCNNAFYQLKAVTSISLPVSLTTIGGAAFAYCTKLEEINYAGNKVQWQSVTKYLNWDNNAGKDTDKGTYTVVCNRENCASGSCGTSATWKYWYDEKRLEILGSGNITDVTKWSEYKYDIKKVEIHEGITNVPYRAFYGYYFLEKVVLPSTVTTIGNEAFCECFDVRTIELPESLESIGEKAFQQCAMLADVELASGIKTIGKGAFSNCASLTSVVIPEGIGTISADMFYGCSNLTDVELPAGLVSLGDNAFRSCKLLKTVELPAGIKTIGANVFNGCSALDNIELPDGLSSLGSGVFQNCVALKSIEIPEGITNVASNLFYGCSTLDNIDIPEGVYSIGSGAFQSCSALKSIKLPEKIQAISNNTFYGCSALESVELPSELKTIGSSAFYNCAALKSVELPKTLTSIGSNAFSRCSMLENIYYNGTNIEWNTVTKTSGWDSNAGSSTSAGKYTLHILGGEGYTGSCGDNFTWTFVPEENLLKIEGMGAMKNWTSSGKPQWSIYADRIYNLEIESGVTTLGSYIFYSCQALKEITLPKSITTIGDYAFYGCVNLETINYAGNKTAWASVTKGKNWDTSAGTSVSAGKYSLVYGEENILSGSCGEGIEWTLWEEKGLLKISGTGAITSASGWTSYRSKITKVEIGEGITSIPEQAFYSVTALLEVTLPSTLESIGAYAFYRCTKMESIEFSKSLKTIGRYAFRDCSLLGDIYYDGTNLDWGALTKESNWDLNAGTSLSEGKYTMHFKGGYVYSGTCEDGLKWRFIPEDAILEISGSGDMVSYSNSKLPIWSCYKNEICRVVIKEGVTTIGDYAFYDYNLITDVSLPESVTRMRIYSFANCENIANIYYAGNEEEWTKLTKNSTGWNYGMGTSVTGGTAIIYNAAFGPRKIELSADSDSVSIKAVSTFGEIEGVFVIALYQQGKMVDMKIVNASETYTGNLNRGNADRVKAFWLESAESIKPLCDAKEVRF